MVRKLFTKNNLLILFIFGFGLALRFYQLGSVPVSLHRDEAFLTYNAYSMLQTGKDISGNFLPLHLESFLFSPAGYSYLSIPFINLFGLNEFSARAASALFGSLTILLIYLISSELFKEDRNKKLISLLSALFLAIMPWHINLSRVAAESVVVVFFICLGVLLYLKYLKVPKGHLLLLSFLAFSVNLFLYQAPRAFLPLFIPLLAFVDSGLRRMRQKKFHFILFLALIMFPVVAIFLSPNLSTRIQNLNIVQHPETKILISEQLVNDTVEGLPPLVSRSVHNKISGYSLLFLDNYFSHLSYGFLFSDESFPDRFRIPNMGLLYIYQLPLILIAFHFLMKKNLKLNIFLFGWIGLSMLGSALTFDDIPNQQRTLLAAPAFALLSGIGASEVYAWIRKRRFSSLMLGMSLLIVSFSFYYFLIQYFVQGKVYRTWYRQDGYKELVVKVNELLPNYDKAIVTSRETGATILFLFYSGYNPRDFQEETKGISTRQSDHISFSKYEFTDEECPLRIDQKNRKFTGIKGVLYVNSSLCENVPQASEVSVIKRAGGSEVFRILEVK